MPTAIVNNFAYPIILADNRNAYTSWTNHTKRGSSGGVDLAYPYATNIAAPADGRLVADNDPGGSGGRIGTLYIDHPQIARIEFLHMLSVKTGQIAIGQSIGLSGASGFGKDRGYDPHLHVHAYDHANRRVNLWNYFTTVAPAGGGSAIKSNIKEKSMYLAWSTDGTGWLVTQDGWHGLPSMQIYSLFRRLINSNQAANQPELFNATEVQMMNSHLQLVKAANQAGVQIDAVKLASALRDELVKVGVPVTIENLGEANFQVDTAALAAAFEAAVPRVSAAIVKQAGQLLAGS